MFRRLISALLLLFCLSIQVYAKQNACNSTAIVQLANYVLAERTDAFSRFEKRNYGSTALYLKIVYGNMPEEEASEAVVRLFKESVRDADQLASAYLLSRYGYEKAADMLGPEFAPKFLNTTSNISLSRAFMLSDERATFLDGLAKASKEVIHQTSSDVVVALLDQPDDIKLQFAKEAESRKLYVMSAGFLLARSDLGEWESFKQRNPAIGNWILRTRMWQDVPPLNGNAILQSGERKELINAFSPYQWSNILAAEYRLSEPPILSRIVNYSGDMAAAARAASDFNNATKNRSLDPESRIELDRLFLFGSLYQTFGIRRDFETHLSAVTSTQNRPFRNTLLDEYDWLVATSTLRHRTDDNGRFPSEPLGLLSEEFSLEWPFWLEAATAVRSDLPIDWTSLTPLQTTIFAELLFVYSKDNRLLSMFEKAKPDALLVRLANDFAIRLDRTCEAYLKRTGSSNFLISVPMYKFDKRSN